MAQLPSGLETTEFGVQGWNDIHTNNMQLLDQRLVNAILASVIFGNGNAQANSNETAPAPAAQTSANLIDSTAGTAGQTINDVGASFDQATLNDNFASLVDECNKYRADIAELHSKLTALSAAFLSLQTEHNNLLAKLRKTGGVGVLAD